MIDLRSDTVTKPTPGMLEAMMKAEVGDDVFQEDPTINALQVRVASIFGHPAALFCPSGTMTNQIGIKTHTQPGDELLCSKDAHVYRYEGGGPSFNSGVSVFPIESERGQFTPQAVEEAVTPKDIHKPESQLVVIENTSNHGGGSCWSLDAIRQIRKVCDKHGMKLHLDGARLYNALVAKNETPAEYGRLFDSISICFSKGLGIPAGSVLIGDQAYINKATRFRKVMGGGLRQGGYLAAAGNYALDHHVERLADDHKQAKKLESELGSKPYIQQVLPVETNIVVSELKPDYQVHDFINKLYHKGIKAVPFGGQKVRMVTHLDVDDQQLDYVIDVLKSL